MEQDVYVDLYFLINASMDFLCLLITSSLLHRKIRKRRLLPAAFLGGIYAVASLFLGTEGWLSLLPDVLMAIVICFLSFFEKKNTASFFFKSVAVFALVSFLTGGIMTGLSSLLNKLKLSFSIVEQDDLSVWGFAVLGGIAGLFAMKGGQFFGFSKKAKSVTVEAVLFGKPLRLNALVDSGNLLKDPLSGRRVILADQEKIHTVLPFLKNAKNQNSYELFLKDSALAKKVRLIPATTATGKSILPAILPDALWIIDGKNRYPSNDLVAPISLGESAKGFDAVIAPEA